MAANLVETIQKSMGFPPLQKIDPNIQETKEKASDQSQEKLAQAAIPAILTALYRFTRSDEGCGVILSDQGQGGLLGAIFQERATTAIEKVAHYAGVTYKEAESTMENVAVEAVNTLKKSAGSHPTPESIKTFMNAQRHNILVYLPAAMQMGDLLNEEGLDDRTNKMEGPISNLVHAIESKLSRSDQSKYP